MSPQDDDSQQGLVLWLVFGLVALVIALVVGVSVYQRGKMSAPKAAVTSAPAAAAPAASAASAVALSAPASGVDPAVAATTAVSPAANATQSASDAASVTVENGVVKFYFASGKADLAAGANAALADVIKGAQAGKKLVISGYHDATGSAVKNAEVAKLRAFAVRDALKAAGVTDDKIELKKPEELKASGSNAQARRVEVMLQ